MKTIYKTKIPGIFLTMIMFVIFCTLTACGGKKDENALVGKWEAVDHEGEVLIFNEDGTYMYVTVNGNNDNGTYKVSDGEIQMASAASGLGADLNKVSGLHEFTLDGDKLSFSFLGFASTDYEKVK